MRDPKLIGTIKLPTIEDAVKAGGFLAGRPEDIIEARKAVDIVRAQPRVEHLCQCNVNGVVSRQVVPQFPDPPQQVTADRILRHRDPRANVRDSGAALVDLMASPAPKAARVRGSGQGPGSPARARRADSRCSSEIPRRSAPR